MTNPARDSTPDPAQVLTVFVAARALPAERREAFVRQQTGADSALADEVLALLRDADATGSSQVFAAGQAAMANLADGLEAGQAEIAPPTDDLASTATGELLRRLADAPKLDTNRYALEDQVGKGGMGVVLRIFDRHLNRRLAMKVMQQSQARGAEEHLRVQRRLGHFLEEAQVTSQLDHPGVVPVHELGLDQDGKVYFTMRLVKGRTAAEIFALARSQQEDWTTTRALEVILRVCDTMAYAHARGVLHRDLKPSNVMVGRFGEVYVMDWGLAKVLRSDGDQGAGDAVDADVQVETVRQRDAEQDREGPMASVAGLVKGTKEYMPPEQMRGETLDQRADVYSIGAMLYELLAGRPPYTSAEIARGALAGPPQRVEAVQPGVPAELVAIVEKAMQREREQRYRSVLDLAGDLRAFLDQRSVKAYRTGALVELKLWVRRNRSLAASLAAISCLLATVLVVAYYSDRVRAREAVANAKAKAASAFASFATAERHMARGEWEPAIGAYDHAERDGYPDHSELALRRVEALEVLHPDKAVEVLLSLDERAFGQGKLARLLVQKAVFETDWSDDSGRGFELLRRARSIGSLEPADDLYAQAMLEPNLRRAWELVRESIRREPGHRRTLQLALPLCLLCGSQNDMAATIGSYGALFRSDPMLPLVIATAMMLDEQPIDMDRAEKLLVHERSATHEDARLSRLLLNVIGLADRERRDLTKRGTRTISLGSWSTALSALVMVGWNSERRSSIVMHPALSRCVAPFKGVIRGLFAMNTVFKVDFRRDLGHLDYLIADGFWDLLRANWLIDANDLDGARHAWASAAQKPTVVSRVVGRDAWRTILLQFEHTLLVCAQRESKAGQAMSAEQRAAFAAWAIRVLDYENAPPDLIGEAVQAALQLGDFELAIEASLRRLRRTQDGDEARYWLAEALLRSGDVQWSKRIYEGFSPSSPHRERADQVLAAFHRRSLSDVAFPMIVAMLKEQEARASAAAVAPAEADRVRQALIWMYRSWDRLDPGKGHADAAAAREAR